MESVLSDISNDNGKYKMRSKIIKLEVTLLAPVLYSNEEELSHSTTVF